MTTPADVARILAGRAEQLRRLGNELTVAARSSDWTGQAAAALDSDLVRIRADLHRAADEHDRAAAAIWAHLEAVAASVDSMINAAGSVVSTVGSAVGAAAHLTTAAVDSAVDTAVDVTVDVTVGVAIRTVDSMGEVSQIRPVAL